MSVTIHSKWIREKNSRNRGGHKEQLNKQHERLNAGVQGGKQDLNF